MARLCTRRNAGKAAINDNGTPVPIPAIFHAPSTTPTQIAVPAEAFALT